jgi:hypothetical protein
VRRRRHFRDLARHLRLGAHRRCRLHDGGPDRGLLLVSFFNLYTVDLPTVSAPYLMRSALSTFWGSIPLASSVCASSNDAL